MASRSTCSVVAFGAAAAGPAATTPPGPLPTGSYTWRVDTVDVAVRLGAWLAVPANAARVSDEIYRRLTYGERPATSPLSLGEGARERVLAKASERNVGVLDMFAVRRALRDVAALTLYLQERIAAGELDDSARALLDVVQAGIDSGECATLVPEHQRFD